MISKRLSHLRPLPVISLCHNLGRDYLLPVGTTLLFIMLYLKSQAIDPHQHLNYMNQLRQVQELDARLNQQVLQTRLGLISSYDPVEDKLKKIKQLHRKLQQVPAFIDSNHRQTINQAIQNHITIYQTKEQKIDQFKSQQAILQNSLAYFPIAITNLTQQPNLDSGLADRLNRLLQQTLLFNLTTMPNLRPEIEQAIATLLTTTRSTPQAATVEGAIAHAQVIVNRRPQVDRGIETILALPTRDRGEAINQAYYDGYQQALNTANLYRLALYALSTVLVITIANTIIRQLRRSSAALQTSTAELEQALEQERSLKQRIEELAAIEERNRIAREIHDSLGHALTALNVQLQAAVSLFSTNPPEAKSFLAQAQCLGITAMQEVRQSVRTLRSEEPDERSLETTIAALAEEFRQVTGIIPTVNFHLTEAIPHRIAKALYRVTQEALTNISKYAQATQVQIEGVTSENQVHLAIVDNGQGFCSNQPRDGFGLQGMQERIAALAGSFSLSTEPGKGCQIKIAVPLSEVPQ
jgi:signal transduction histidine kinase